MALCGGGITATPITFTHAGVASGTLGSVSFTNAAFTITDIGDTSARVLDPFGAYYIADNSASISIAGLGTFSINISTTTFVNNNLGLVGFSRVPGTGSDILDGPINSAFTTWDMLNSIGPISGTANSFTQRFGSVATSGGALTLINPSDAAPSIPIVFTATLANAPDVNTPEPATPILITAGISVLTLLRKRYSAN